MPQHPPIVRRGDHVFVERRFYTHHGVVVDDGQVVHFTGAPGSKRGAEIRCTPLEEFRGGGVIRVRRYGVCNEPDLVVENATSRLGDDGYNLFNNNCEHFAQWCLTGYAASAQVARAMSTGGVVSVAGAGAAAGVGVIGAAGTATGLSGAGVMSGLAAIGGIVGTGAVGGLVALSTAPAIGAAAIMQVALKDDERLPRDERDARRAGRVASIAGSAAGAAGGVAGVSALGAVGGLSAAGITSGLAAMGALVGGGMVAGSAVVIAAPAVGAAAIGYGAYQAVRRWKRREGREVDDQ